MLGSPNDSNVGDLRHTYKSKEDFSGLCFRCGGSGHAARYCNAPPSCKICMIDGKAFSHRLGSNFCPAAKIPTRRETTSAAAVSASAASGG